MIRVRLLTPALELVLERLIPRDLRTDVVMFDGGRYLLDRSTGDHYGDLPIYHYVEETTYAMETP